MNDTRNQRVALARTRTMRALRAYESYTTADLLTEIRELHADLDSAEHGGFSPSARSGLRSVLLTQLQDIDQEWLRRSDQAA